MAAAGSSRHSRIRPQLRSTKPPRTNTRRPPAPRSELPRPCVAERGARALPPPGPDAGGGWGRRGPGAAALPAQQPQPRAGRGGRSGAAAAARRAMSAPCLRLPAAGSAPAEADSAGGMEPPAAAAAAGAAAAAALELALEEELALLAAAGEPPEPPPAAAARDPELLSLIRQKEKDLVLAARLGKALLERNQDMSRQYERMHKELTDKLEVRPRRPPPSLPPPRPAALRKGPRFRAAVPGSPAVCPREKRPLPRQMPGAAGRQARALPGSPRNSLWP